MSSSPRLRRNIAPVRFRLLAFVLGFALLGSIIPSHFIPFISTVQAVSPNLVISQVYGGGGNMGATYTHDFIEIYNRGAVAVPLTGMSLQYASATGTGNFGANTTQLTELPNVSIQPGQTYLVQQAGGANGSPLPTPDFTDLTPINMSGTAGKVALVTGATTLGCNGGSTACSPAALARIVDLVGYGNANFSETAPAPTLTNSTAAIRAGGGTIDTDNNSADFTAATPAPRTPETAPSVSSTAPADNAIDVAANSNITINFSEPVDVSGSWFTITCSTSGGHSAQFTNNANFTSYTLNPDSNFGFNETCTVTVNAGQVSDRDINDPPDQMASNYSFSFATGPDPCTSAYTNIFTIQGSESASQYNNTNKTIRGIVVGDFQHDDSFDGFYVQDEAGDGDTATSDGIFVFAPGGTDVAVGDEVVVSGKVQEFNGLTEIGNVTAITQCGTGTIIPTTVDLPEAVDGDLERYEGMLVTIPEKLTISETFNLGRFGELMLSSDGRMFQQNNFNTPNSPGALAEAEAYARRRIILDDGISSQNPNPMPYLGPDNTRRIGDTVQGLIGVLDFRFAEYRVQPTVAPVFNNENPRTAAPDPVGGNVKLASFNVLNYFTTLDLPGENATDGRGANTPQELERQRSKVVAALKAIDADVVGLIEIENVNFNPSNNPEAIDDLVAALNAAYGSNVYQYALGANPGTDLVMNAIIYKPSRVTPIGPAVNAVDTDGDNVWAQARNPLAQTFKYNANNEKFTYIVNHFTSKGCSSSDTGEDDDQGDGQGCDNFQRKQQANALLAFIADLQAASGDPDVLVMGDLNAYGKEDAINILTAGGLVNEIERFVERPYSYVFDAQSGYLDHALSTGSLSAQVSGVTEWHINADEPRVLDYNLEFKQPLPPPASPDLYEPSPYRSSDHDPVIVGLDLNATPEVGAINATPNPVIINGTVNTTASFTDADTDDTHTALWNWGDGSTSPGVVTESNGIGSVAGSHIYNAPGTYTVTLTVTDDNGNSDTSTTTITVTYGIVALFDQSKANKSGSTIPIKLQLVDANGNNLSAASTEVHIVGLTLNSTAVSGTDYDSGNANPDNNFRFDPTIGGTGGYIFNLSTKNLNLVAGEYTLYFTVTGDPVTHTVTFKVK